ITAGDLPVEGEVPAVVVAHRQVSIASLILVCGNEPVHRSVVVLPADDGSVRVQLRGLDSRQQEWLNASFPRAAHHPGLAGASRGAFGTRIAAEVVVESTSPLHEEDEVLDGGAGGGAGAGVVGVALRLRRFTRCAPRPRPRWGGESEGDDCHCEGGGGEAEVHGRTS